MNSLNESNSANQVTSPTQSAQNDENYYTGDEVLLSKGLDIVSKTFAREKGDIRQALNIFKSVIHDANKQKRQADMTSIFNSIKKRRQTYENGNHSLAKQVALMILATSNQNSIPYSQLIDKYVKVCSEMGLPKPEPLSQIIGMLEAPGLISMKNYKGQKRIVLTATKADVETLITQKDMIEKHLQVK